MREIQLFGLPYAGGSSFMYEPLRKSLSEQIKLIPLEYAGHGERMQEELYPSFHDMVLDMTNQIESRLTSDPFAILGYSMGSLAAYEITQELIRRTMRNPLQLFVAAHAAPHLHQASEPVYEAVAARFKANMLKMGMSDLDVMNNVELLECFVPIFYHDLKLYAGYQYSESKKPLDVNLTVLYSDEENRHNQIFEWSAYTSKACLYQRMKGNHFFIHSHMEEMVQVINQSLMGELIHH
ncbi:thioesterase II family protein [Paenibacillus aquistagni]|uniref:thioesterase II family protein n=1 Tax=Paenibacillus aquistagni TaxID=1852522 RepID=UPI00145AFBFD|nr:thioesterase [Paenibacillus aquistagni]NMM51082.1 thioesterase [Paenibacillus aquistagni]